ncbi:MAG: GAF domain-containing protein [Wenzhouxiangella sp.]
MNARCGRLQVFVSQGPIPELMLEPGQRYRVGRAREAHCHIDDESVSRHHLEIDTTGWPWHIRDLGSKNGSRLSGKPLGSADLAASCWMSIAGIPARIEITDSRTASRWRRDADTRRLTARQLGRGLRADLSRPELLERIVRSFMQLAECDAGALFLSDEHGRSEMVHDCGQSLSGAGRSVVEDVLRTSRPVVVSDLAVHRALASRESIVSGGIRALVCLPLIVEDQVRGALFASSRAPGKTFTRLDHELLEGLARQAAFVVALDRMREEAARLRMELPESPEGLASSGPLSAVLERVLPPVGGR